MAPLRKSLVVAVLLGCALTAQSATAGTYVVPPASPGVEQRTFLVTQRITVEPAQRERDRAIGSGTFLRPEVRPGSRPRPSDYYRPPPREPEPFYHYRRVTPPVAAPAYRCHQP